LKQSTFEKLYRPTWVNLLDVIEELENRSFPTEKELKEFTSLFRKVCHFHALAKERNYSSYLVDQLEDIVVRAHQQIYRRKRAFFPALIHFIVKDFPKIVYEEARFVWASTLLFVAPILIILFCSLVAPELVFTVISPDMAEQMEQMYNPDNTIVGSARDAETNWAMFGFYIQNNISVAFRTFATGIVLGIGSGFFLIYNGALLGAVSAHLIHLGYTTTFFTFVIAHGSFELIAIVLAGAAGIKMGYSLLSPGQYTRAQALKLASERAIQIVFGVIVMLTIAAFIEAFWSSNNSLVPNQKYLVGASLWVIVIAYLMSGRRFARKN